MGCLTSIHAFSHAFDGHNIFCTLFVILFKDVLQIDMTLPSDHMLPTAFPFDIYLTTGAMTQYTHPPQPA